MWTDRSACCRLEGEEDTLKAGPPLSQYPDLGDRVYYLLREQILTAKLPPGSLLLGVELARDLGVSRTPVADALNLLASEGLVEVVPRKGYFVTTLDIQAYLDLMDARLAIEMAAAERGIAKASEAQRAALRQQHAQVSEFSADSERPLDYPEWAGRDARFHELLVETSGNPYLMEAYGRLSARAQLAYIRFSLSAGIRPVADSVGEHEAILAAFLAGDLAALQVAITTHVDRLRQFHAARSQAIAARPLAQQQPAARVSKRLHWPGRNRPAEGY